MFPLLAQERPLRTVLTIHAGSQFFPANPVMDAAIREILTSHPGISVDIPDFTRGRWKSTPPLAIVGM